MNTLFRIRFLVLFLFLIEPFILVAQHPKNDRLTKKAITKLSQWKVPAINNTLMGRIKVDSVSVDRPGKHIFIEFNEGMSYLPIREDYLNEVQNSVKNSLGHKFRKYKLELYSDKHLLSDLIPNIFRKETPADKSRYPKSSVQTIPLVRKVGGEPFPSGLDNRNIAIWHSHGYYYQSKFDRWQWQRARLFGTVEDISTMTYVLPYLVPMLENSGCTVFLPKERDTQLNEVIVDNDFSDGRSELIKSSGLSAETVKPGFLKKDTLFSNDNPFRLGTSLRFQPAGNNEGVTYIPDIPERGKYAVTISYVRDEANSENVKYTVKHLGGETSYLVNQRIGGGTWIYLGTFDFGKGMNPATGAVLVQGSGKTDGWISTDAIRFGGGYGNVARRPDNEIIPNVWSLNSNDNARPEGIKVNARDYSWKISNKPRFVEGSRYYLQYAGMPDSSVYNQNRFRNDYNDDYQSRGAWVNFLTGKDNKGMNNGGLNIPIDLSLAFHTDAGITPNDSIIGTLGIYSTVSDKGIFANGQSKATSRDLTDIVQTQIVNDLRSEFNPKWTRRGMWDKQYNEAWKPVVPAMLLELLSHQNQADVKFGLDPRFRFSVARAIYKGMLKYISFQDGRPYIVQPLPVEQLALVIPSSKTVRLSWKPVQDTLEPGARALRYKVYKRVDDAGFDNGTLVSDTACIIRLDKYNTLYSFKVTALNEGGESFPSEVLSVGLVDENTPKVLVVNGFTRVSGPSFVDSGNVAGVSWWDDQGVPDHFEIGHCGLQYDFQRKNNWLTDDNPGWGASYSDMEGKLVPGNSFDFPYIHGKAIMNAGYSFVSVSNKAFCTPNFDIRPFQVVDILLGKQKTTPEFKNPDHYSFRIYTPEFLDKLDQVIANKTGLLMSGAYIGSDLSKTKDTIAINFARKKLHFTWQTGHAVKDGKVYTTDLSKDIISGKWNFNTEYNPTIYTVESPDAIEPAGQNAIAAFRYRESNNTAGVIYNGDYKAVITGFPFETITDEMGRNRFMNQALIFLSNKTK